ncbi:unnamed protein product [Schistosoma rodhaini]|nr:28 kDa heat-and acid-stable phosphoprotein (PDGF-associated protein) (PAP) (PDGFA-associated protein 1) (PAP1), putative [Schistosoma mansoni]CAH8607040.1 unnamed protein product [Schistosoma rodhaini]|eukprot:XP_018646805.1 28 kDa heat-and acid-stable phosphoprotein (PDGF-associated protein) (PAP) (PDGFA-associated protein 1) (PAP1), putative [Schistosoma mansoni]
MRGKRMHKGRTRKFTAPEEIDRQLGISKEAESSLNKTIHDKNINDTETDDDDEEEEEEEDEDDEEDTSERHKGVSHLIEVCNPNRIKSKTVAPSRKEIAASIKATTDPIKLLSETELAANIARLQLVRKERELAAQKLEQEKQAREAQRAATAAAKRTSQTKPQQKSGRSGKQHTNSNKEHQTVNQRNNINSSEITDDN